MRTSIQREAASSSKRFTPKRVFAAPVALGGGASPSPHRAGAIAKKLTFPSPGQQRTAALDGSRKRKGSIGAGGTTRVVGSGAFGEARQKKLNTSGGGDETTADVVELARQLQPAAGVFDGTAKRLVFQLSPLGPVEISAGTVDDNDDDIDERKPSRKRSASPSRDALVAEVAALSRDLECEFSPSMLAEKLVISSAKKPAVAPSQFAVKRLFNALSSTPPPRRQLAGGAMRVNVSASSNASASSTSMHLSSSDLDVSANQSTGAAVGFAATAVTPVVAADEPPPPPAKAQPSGSKRARAVSGAPAAAAGTSILSKMAPVSKARSGGATSRLAGGAARGGGDAFRRVPAQQAVSKPAVAGAAPRTKVTIGATDILAFEKRTGRLWHHLTKEEKAHEMQVLKESKENALANQ